MPAGESLERGTVCVPGIICLSLRINTVCVFVCFYLHVCVFPAYVRASQSVCACVYLCLSMPPCVCMRICMWWVGVHVPVSCEFVCVCVCARMPLARLHVYLYAYVCMFMRKCAYFLCVYLRVRIRMCVCACVCLCVYTCAFACTCINKAACTHMRIRMCVRAHGHVIYT